MNYGEIWLFTTMFKYLAIIGIVTQLGLWIAQVLDKYGFFNAPSTFGAELDYIHKQINAGYVLDPPQYWKEGDYESNVVRPRTNI
ncbi:hypothetical protein [uncultured Mediterranean phage uvMED]|nr:hypothetical protein [uncultured Mediterranean phage uvMED]BAQ84832.1 hypothetical protein [uncultured Mediterranean phage uvMED]BAQ84883.1 hypothetical protein [uncultured Mediterranean phage uvMED]BAR13803.1 hypothetical protein [uncultured Mediterranean phage uvMED]BAR14838.1 hypothetical protein [uncultured Mediterranean phage uvMED]